jgi:hypothetical protein
VVAVCTDYMSDQQPIGVPCSRHEGRLARVGLMGLELTYILVQKCWMRHILRHCITHQKFTHLRRNARKFYLKLPKCFRWGYWREAHRHFKPMVVGASRW